MKISIKAHSRLGWLYNIKGNLFLGVVIHEMIYQGYTGNTEHSKHIEHILLVTNANNRHQLSPHRKFQNDEISLCQFR